MIVAAQPDQLRAGVIGTQHDRTDPPGRRVGGGHDSRTGAVGEQRDRVAVVEIEKARQEIGAHDQHVLRAA